MKVNHLVEIKFDQGEGGDGLNPIYVALDNDGDFVISDDPMFVEYNIYATPDVIKRLAAWVEAQVAEEDGV